MLARWLLLVLVVGIAACSPDVVKVNATGERVAVNHAPERRQEADRLAAATCADYGRNARLRYRHDQYWTMDQFGIYDCIPR